MKIITQIKPAWRKLLLGGLCALPLSVFSQTVFTVPSGIPTVSPPPRPGLGGTQPPSLAGLNSAFAALTPLAKWGSLNIRPYMSYQLLYGDGILRVPGEPTNTTQQSVSLGASAGLGKHWKFDYNVGRTWYSTRLIADNTNHAASLSGGISKGDWTFGIFQNYGSNSLTLVETGQQTPAVSYTTGGSVAYQLGSRTLLDVAGSRSTRDSDLPPTAAGGPVPDVEQWSGTVSLHYRFSTKLDIGLGMQFGYDSISISSDMNTSQPQLTVNWRPTSKLSFTGSGGVETRTFKSADSGELENNVYSLAASYQPTQSTGISLSANSAVSPSYFANQVSKTTGWGISAQQRFLQRYFLTGSFSHGKNSYIVTNQNFVVGRDDDFDAFSAGISTTFLSRGSISFSYQKSRNSSTTPGYGFTSSQIGTSIVYRF